MVIYLLPNDVIEQRIRELKNKRTKKGRKTTFSSKYSDRIPLNLFLTNTDKEQVSTKKVWGFYRLRWQIELVFKIWKSFCGIDKVKKVQIYRLQCYIYAKLILILLGWQVLWKVAALMDEHGKQLSFLKAFKTLMGTMFERLRKVFLRKKASIKNFMLDFFHISFKKHLLEKRKEMPTSRQILKQVIKAKKSGYNEYNNILGYDDKQTKQIA